MNRGSKHFNTYRTLFLIKGILNLVGIIFFLMYALIGYFVSESMDAVMAADLNAPEMPINPGSIFLVIGIIGAIIFGTVGALLIAARPHFKAGGNRQFIQIAAAINCFTGLLGILLCIFTSIEINRADVKAAFEGQEYAPSNRPINRQDDILDL